MSVPMHACNGNTGGLLLRSVPTAARAVQRQCPGPLHACNSSIVTYFGCAVYLPRHKSGRNKGFGFTTFESEEELSLALQVGAPLPPSHHQLAALPAGPPTHPSASGK